MARQRIFILSELLILSVIFHSIESQQCGIDTYSIYQMMLKGHTFETFKARPMSLDCREACNSDVRCQSYNYLMFKDICELNNRTKEASPEDFVRNNERYYMKKAPNRVPLGSISELPADSCREIKASEGAQTVSGNYWLDSTRSGNSILARCDMDTETADYCFGHQCQNNATCVNSHVNYTCTCNSWRWTGDYCERECKEALGMESGAITDGQITASSEYDNNHAAVQGRLHFKLAGIKRGAWSAGVLDDNQWLQIDLGNQHTRVTRVATQGRNGHWDRVTEYRLQYSDDELNFQYYKDQGQAIEKDFAGNTDQDTVVYHDLNPPITARYIRFRPVAWYSYISMRAEFYGCRV
ncbi:lactadherin-like [Oculina patagonica]